MKGFCDTKHGRVSVKWKKTDNKADVEIEIPDGLDVFYNNEKLNPGINKYTFEIK